ncbi:MAG: hypothetical protein AB7T49_09845 [Oligoflexales bacterium]
MKANWLFFGSLWVSAFLGGCKTPRTGSDIENIEIVGETYRLPDQIDEKDNLALWTKYCVANPAIDEKNEVGFVPDPNYEDPLVASASKMLSRIDKSSFGLNDDINLKYVNRQRKPANVTTEAHDFLTYLCGEFRDRATMIESKLRWLANMNYLPSKPNSLKNPTFDPKKDEWAQMTAEMYLPYVEFAKNLFEVRLAAEQLNLGVRFEDGQVKQVDRPVAPLTVCENRYIFANYISKGKSFPGLDSYAADYDGFKKTHCGSPELDYYYDFRGDSEIKPNSPESSGMIWYSLSVALQCTSTTKGVADLPIEEKKAFVEKHKIQDQIAALKGEDCVKYYKEPFKHRWLAARAALGSWALHGDEHSDAFYRQRGDSPNIPLEIIPSVTSPLAFSMGLAQLSVNSSAATFLPGADQAWIAPDFGIMDYANKQQEIEPRAFIYERLSGAVDTHVESHASGYDDKLNQNRSRDEGYSPLLASNYDMSKSETLTRPGIVVPGSDRKAREFRHFMSVFKIHRNNLYTSEDIAKGRNLDFDRMWLDETSLGNSSEAKQDRGWDRLGTTLEQEYHALLYLGNLCANGKIRKEGQSCNP